jgi:hypothetical protein
MRSPAAGVGVRAGGYRLRSAHAQGAIPAGPIAKSTQTLWYFASKKQKTP